MTNAVASLDDVKGYHFFLDYINIPENIDISSPSLAGRKIKIQQLKQKPFLVFCAVCNNSYYGVNCVKRSGNCLLQTCYPVTGVCVQGCTAGYCLPYCNMTCSMIIWCPLHKQPLWEDRITQYMGCAQQVVYLDIGRCIVKQHVRNTCGSCFKGKTCNASPGDWLRSCNAGISVCIKLCSTDTYGIDCKEMCGNCTENSLRNLSIGSYDKGYTSGYKLP